MNNLQIVKTKEDAYTLGFAWADGHLNKKYSFRIQINKKDADDLYDTFMKFEDFNIYDKTYKHTKTPTWQDSRLFYKTNKQKYMILEEHGFRDKSTCPHDSILELIPNQFRYLFWRGLFDGDGNVYIRPNYNLGQISIASSYEQDWSAVCELFDSLDIKHSIKHQISGKNKSSCIRVVELRSISLFFKYIYPDSYDDIGLYRKYDKLEKLHIFQKEKEDMELVRVNFIKDNSFIMMKKDICKSLCISNEMLSRIIKQYSIDTPPRNYWHNKSI
tara:strand:+ start:15652 stop:16470 length:819 start_codon:yes stop_codon:yes gene_type:complete